MCIAILNKTELLSKETIKTCWMNNPDGGGLIFTDGKKLQTFKELKNVDKFYQKYRDIRTKTNYPIVLHFRIATSGKVNEANCHPFNVNNKLSFVHNGMIDINHCNNYSDTYYFNLLLSSLPDKFLGNEAIKELLSAYIGHSKLIFLNNEGQYTLINEEFGHWDDFGNWFSNHSYKPYQAKKKSKKEYSFDHSKYYDMYFDEKEEAKDDLFLSCECCIYNEAKVFNKHWDANLCTECNETYTIND